MRGTRGALLVSALDSGSTGPGSSPGRVIVLCSWAKHFTVTVSLSIQEYAWVLANCQGNLTGVVILLVTPGRQAGRQAGTKKHENLFGDLKAFNLYFSVRIKKLLIKKRLQKYNGIVWCLNLIPMINYMHCMTTKT